VLTIFTSSFFCRIINLEAANAYNLHGYHHICHSSAVMVANTATHVVTVIDATGSLVTNIAATAQPPVKVNY